ncbi:glycosyltransferase [Confluentibacter sediminis]|uniref:glycosyltransferase n=1 Tax=Confluentibacter sediminis TaxID=2219045 RepID=UPI001F2FBFAD|nr:glycosyltransferase [Confluentibacter sediminis]
MSQKILHVVSSMDPVFGGVSKAVRTIATSLMENGIVNEVVSLDDIQADFINNDSFKLHALGSSKNPWAYNSKLLPWLKDNLHYYDVVMVHGLWLYSSYVVYLAINSMRKQDRLKYFVMPHGMLDPYFQKAEGRRLKAIRNWLYWKLIEYKVVNNADGLLFTCEEERLLAKQPFKPYKPKKEYIVGLGVDVPPIHNADMDKAFQNCCKSLENRPFLLFLSRIHQKKGVDLLLEAYKRCISEVDLDLVIAGPGCESDYGKYLLKTVSEDSKLKSRVHFTGMLSGNAKWGAFYNADAFILPSHQENFGIAVVEALACGTPVLISDKVNIWREIKNGNGGFVEQDDLRGTTNLILKWVALKTHEKKIMEQNAKKTFLEHYAIQLVAKRLVELLIKPLEIA